MFIKSKLAWFWFLISVNKYSTGSFIITVLFKTLRFILVILLSICTRAYQKNSVGDLRSVAAWFYAASFLSVDPKVALASVEANTIVE